MNYSFLSSRRFRTPRFEYSRDWNAPDDAITYDVHQGEDLKYYSKIFRNKEGDTKWYALLTRHWMPDKLDYPIAHCPGFRTRDAAAAYLSLTWGSRELEGNLLSPCISKEGVDNRLSPCLGGDN